MALLNVRYGSKADIPRLAHLCPLLGEERTFGAGSERVRL